MQQDLMGLYDTAQTNIHLVTYVPRLDYSHRLLAAEQLVEVQLEKPRAQYLRTIKTRGTLKCSPRFNCSSGESRLLTVVVP